MFHREEGSRALNAFAASSVAAALSAGVHIAVFDLFATAFQPFRQPRVEGAFHPIGYGSLVCLALCVLVGAACVYRRRSAFWLIPLGVLVSAFYMPAFAYSGPGDLLTEVMPLIDLKMVMPVTIVVLDAALLSIWVSHLNSGGANRLTWRIAARH